MPGLWQLTPAEVEAWELDAHCCGPGQPCFAGAAALVLLSGLRAAWEPTLEDPRAWDFDANCCAGDRLCWFGTLIADGGRLARAGAPAAP